jgi:hypothetical protein
MAEFLVGELRARLRPGVRIGFIEPDFRAPLARLAYLETSGRPELAPLRIWATAINQLYLARRISPSVGATLGRAMEAAGYRRVRSEWFEHPTDTSVVENIVMFYDEVGDTLAALNILTPAEINEQQRLLRASPGATLPAAWGAHVVACES